MKNKMHLTFNYFKKALFFLIIINTGCFYAHTKSDVWEQFIQNPNKNNYLQIIEKFESFDKNQSRRLSSPEEVIGESTNIFLEKLFSLVKQGDYFSCHLIFDLYLYFPTNSSFKEELNSVVGNIVVVDAYLFLELIHKYIFKSPEYYRLKSMVTATGDLYTDNLEAQLIENTNRFNAINAVSSKNLKAEKERCLLLLKEKNNFLKKLISSKK